jgi:hypothetical protein
MQVKRAPPLAAPLPFELGPAPQTLLEMPRAQSVAKSGAGDAPRLHCGGYEYSAVLRMEERFAQVRFAGHALEPLFPALRQRN